MCLRRRRLLTGSIVINISRLFAKNKCLSCGEKIFSDEFVMRTSDSYIFHLKCFVCVVCGVQLQKGVRSPVCVFICLSPTLLNFAGSLCRQTMPTVLPNGLREGSGNVTKF